LSEASSLGGPRIGGNSPPCTATRAGRLEASSSRPRLMTIVEPHDSVSCCSSHARSLACGGRMRMLGRSVMTALEVIASDRKIRVAQESRLNKNRCWNPKTKRVRRGSRPSAEVQTGPGLQPGCHFHSPRDRPTGQPN
jgi:hypothetical protein